MTAAEFVEGLRQLAPDVSLEQIGITFGTAKWSRPATAEELADRAVHNARHREKTEEWERVTYARLKAKFEDAAPAPGLDHPAGRGEGEK